MTLGQKIFFYEKSTGAVEVHDVIDAEEVAQFLQDVIGT